LQREPLEIIIEILRNAHEPINITNLLYATRITYAHIKRLVEDLVKRGLLVTVDPGELDRQRGGYLKRIGPWLGKPKLQRTRTYYNTSEKGKEILRLYDQFKALFEA
jgi:predicted transcriptional regulator